MAVHGYIRASTSRQQASPEVQRDQIAAYCKLHHLEEPLWYVDEATTAKILMRDRQAGGVLIGSLKKGDHVVVSKLDRAFRRLADCVVILDMFKRIGVSLHVVNLLGGAIDLTSPIGMFLMHMLAAFAELEREFISERIRDNIRARKARGESWSGPCPYGFKEVLNIQGGIARKMIVPCPAQRAVMGMIVKMRHSGMEWDAMRQKLNYELGLKSPRGVDWGHQTLAKAYKAELVLQHLEAQRDKQEKEDDHQ